MAYASFGVITPVLSVLISSFMLGLSLGSWQGGKFIEKLRGKFHLSPIFLYAVTEIAIAVGAIIVPQWFVLGEQILYGLEDMDSLTYLMFSGLVITASVLPVCFLMGTTFPFMMAYIKDISENHQKSFSYLYTANVIGAMLGTMFTALVFIEVFGLTRTLYIGGFLNFFIGAICLIFIWDRKKMPVLLSEAPAHSDKDLHGPVYAPSTGRTFLLFILFLTGLISMSMEVIWTRAFTPVMKTMTYSFASLLTVYLLATWLGSLFYRKQLEHRKTISNRTLLCAFACFSFLPLILNDPRLDTGVISVLISIFPLCATLGYLTPKLIDDYSSGSPSAAGKAYAVNIIGCIAGPLVASYLLLPFLGIKNGLIILNATFLILILSHYGVKLFKIELSAFTFIFAFFFLWRASFVHETYEEVFARKSNSVIRRDYTATVVSCGEGFKMRLYVNGISITHLTPIAKYMAHLPLVLCKNPPESALAICMGMGTTYRSLLSWNIQSTAVELVPSVKEAFGFYFTDADCLLKHPKGNIIIDDGRRFLKRTSDQYDVITIDPPPPIEAAGSSLLYSKEFYEDAKQHLKKGGVLQQWFPFGEKKILQAVTRSIYDSFKHIRVYHCLEGWGFHFLASDEPIRFPDLSKLSSIMPDSAKDDFLEWFMEDNLEDDLAFFFQLVIDKEIPVEQLLNEDTSVIITDDIPYNEYFLLRRFWDKLHNRYQKAS